MNATYDAIAMRQGNSPIKTAVCDDITVTYQWDTDIGTVILCRALVAAGKPDGAMLFEDDSGYSIAIPSIHAWVEHQPTYQGQFFRGWNAAFTSYHESDGIRTEPVFDENGIVKLCRAMRDAGKPDGDLMLTETRKTPLRHYIPSIYRWAEYRLVSEAAEAERNGLPVEKSKAAETKSLSDEWYKLLVALKNDDTSLWTTAHHLSRSRLVKRGYVTEAGILTDAGKTAIAHYDNPPTYKDMAPAQLAEIAKGFGLHLNGNASDLVTTLSTIDAVIANQTLDGVHQMAARYGIAINYGKGNRSDALKKRIVLVEMLNKGHEIAA